MSADPGSRSTLLTTTAAGISFASATTSSRSMSCGMGAGSTVAVTTKTWSTLAATGRAPRPSGTRRSSSAVRGSTPTMAWSSASGSGSRRTRSPTTTRVVSRLALPAQHRADLSVRGGDAVDRPIALEHRAEQGRHHSDGRPGDRLVQRGLDVVQRERLEPLGGLLSRPAPGERLGLDVAHRPVAAGGPAHEQQRGAVEAAQVGLLVDVDGHRVGLAVAASEGRGALVLGHVAAQRQLAHRPGTDSRTMLPRKKAMLAGRSASRRMR